MKNRIMRETENHFEPFRRNIIGNDFTYETPYGLQKLKYFDWIAGGRLYRPIEEKISDTFGPYVANTHTETSETGTLMTHAYHYAHQLIKDHVHAGPGDVILTPGFGMTAAVVKLQRILGLKGCGIMSRGECIHKMEKPVVFLTHMEHHSNHTSWLETNADVIVIPAGEGNLVDPANLEKLLEEYKDRKLKIGAFTAASNITGVIPPYYEMARLMHQHGGYAFIDFAASAPYVDIDMHPSDPLMKLDAIYFSPHKFLGGPGASGVLIFDSAMYRNIAPDQPGGGTVDWTNPWGEYKYMDDIEMREDGGTPGFIEAFRSALAIQLKEKMGTEMIARREEEIIPEAMRRLRSIPGIHVLADNVQKRIGAVSFRHDKIHYNLIVKLLSDRYGIQVRGGCACAGTYGHILLGIDKEESHRIAEMINSGDLSGKPGFVRWSIHPTLNDEEIDYFATAIEEIVAHGDAWGKDYTYDKHTNEFTHYSDKGEKKERVKAWFEL